MKLPARDAQGRPVRGAKLAAATVLVCVAVFHSAAHAQHPRVPPPPPTPPPPPPSSSSSSPSESQPAQPAPAPPAATTQPAPPPPPPPPAPAPAPAPAPSPPGYPPSPYGPPPGYPGYYPQQYYTPPPQPRGVHRPFTLGLGLGVGGLAFYDAFGRTGEVGLSYTLRVGFGITRNWLVFLGVEGTGVNHANHGVWQSGFLLGAQYFLFNRLYLRAGLGLANSSADDGATYYRDETGQAFMAGAGFELAQGYNTSLAVEFAVTVGRYPGETWTGTGLNFVLNFF